MNLQLRQSSALPYTCKLEATMAAALYTTAVSGLIRQVARPQA